MQNPKVAVIGAGAMGGAMAGALAKAGAAVTILDTDADHVAAIAARGLGVDGLIDPPMPVPAATASDRAGWADLAVVMTPAFETGAAAQTAHKVLTSGGSAVSLQNGLGNAEALIDVLGPDRVFMGSTRSSADRPAPGHPRITKIDPTKVGELDGKFSDRAAWLAEALSKGGMPTQVDGNIQGVLWSKFIHNCCINALSAITGLRMAEVSRVPGLGALRWEVAEEALSVARAKGIALEKADPVPEMQMHTWRKFTKPSMLQHVDHGRPIEIDAINGWLVREAEPLGIAVPLNRAVTALARGRALAAAQALAPEPDYAALTEAAQAQIDRGEKPWSTS